MKLPNSVSHRDSHSGHSVLHRTGAHTRIVPDCSIHHRSRSVWARRRQRVHNVSRLGRKKSSEINIISEEREILKFSAMFAVQMSRRKRQQQLASPLLLLWLLLLLFAVVAICCAFLWVAHFGLSRICNKQTEQLVTGVVVTSFTVAVAVAFVAHANRRHSSLPKSFVFSKVCQTCGAFAVRASCDS